MVKILVVFFFQFSIFSSLQAQSLTDQINAGTIQIVYISGNGSSSGAALEGTLRNITSSAVSLDVNLLEPLYFRNNGPSQNMVATQLYEADGAYYTRNGKPYISIPANSDLRVMLIAYCADFERDNPGSDARFSVEAMPNDLLDAARRIASFEASNPSLDSTVASQVALWLARGWSPQEIQAQFSFTSDDLTRARAILF